MQKEFDDSFESLRRFVLSENAKRSTTPLVVSLRLTGVLVVMLQTFLGSFKKKEKVKQSHVFFEALTLYFTCATLGPVEEEEIEIVVRRKSKDGDDLRDVNLADYLNLPLLTAYRNKRVE